MKDHCKAPPAPPCLLRKNFQPPPDTIFACWDIREIQREKMIAYAHALQYWAEKPDLPTGGQTCWLAKSVKELQKEMKCYLYFSDREVFEGVTSMEGMPSCPVEEAEPLSMMTAPTTTSKEQAVKETPQKPVKEMKFPKYPRWEKMLHPSWPVVVAGQPPHPSRSLEWTYLLVANCNQHTDIVPPEPPFPPWELEVAHQWAPTPGFLEVTTCLRGQLPREVPKTPPVPLEMGMMTAPGVTTMSASHVIQDEATRATYLDTVTTSVGRVTLSGPEGEIPMLGPKIEDVTDLI